MAGVELNVGELRLQTCVGASAPLATVTVATCSSPAGEVARTKVSSRAVWPPREVEKEMVARELPSIALTTFPAPLESAKKIIPIPKSSGAYAVVAVPVYVHKGASVPLLGTASISKA